MPNPNLKLNLPASSLNAFYNYTPQIGTTANSTPMMITPKTQTLPNGGGTFNPAGDSAITPTPIFTGAQPVNQIKTVAPKAPQRNFYKKDGSYYYSDTNQKILNVNELQEASKTGVEVAAPGGQTGITQIEGVNYDKYRDPKTGEIMTPEEYAIYLGNKIPKGNGEIANYAGDALTNPNQSAAELTERATNLNISRNDIATGTTDPYGVGNTSGIAYSPAELKAIESAYAGVYDPALNDVFARLKEKQAADAEEIAAKQEEAKVVREQQNALEKLAVQHGYSMELKRTPAATSGGGSGGGGTDTLRIQRGADGYVNPNEYIQEAYAYERSGKTMSDFVKKFPPANYINPNDRASLPAFLQPKEDSPLSATEIDSLIWQWLAVPENAALSDEEKALQIKQNGRNPESFGVYGG